MVIPTLLVFWDSVAYKTETHFVGLMNQTVSRSARTPGFVQFRVRSVRSRMMISTQTIRMCSPRTPQPGICITSPVSLSVPWRRRAGSPKWSSGFQNGRGYSGTWAIKLASPFFSSAEDASDDEVPVKDTGVQHDSTGTKTVELLDPDSLAKPESIVVDQLPPLLSMIIDGLPPLQQSKYVHEAEKRLHQYAERYQNVISFDSYCRVGLSAASYVYPGVISLDRLVAISIYYALGFLLDDLLFDAPDEFLLDQCGISHSACGSPQNIQEYLDHLDAVFSQQVQPCNPTPLIEIMLSESGRDMLELSNPEWFNNYVACIIEHHRISVASHANIVHGHNLCFHDLESYTAMRAGNVGGKFGQLLIEFANNTYIPGIMRSDPYLEKVTMATSIHLGFANDVFSYDKEILQEQNPRNLINVLVECERQPLIRKVHMAIGLVNTYARALMDLKAEAWNSTLQNHLQDIKALIAGNVYFSSMDKRYRHPDSIFLELRDITSSWKILPHANGPRL